jgi:RHS repeat-associated protein
VETYTFTYTRELKVETISLNAQVLHRFGYDPNGNRVADKRQDGTLVYYVGGYYEYSVNGTETHTTKYYGSEAMRVDNDLRFILSDHLGSTSVVTDGSGNYLAQQRYDAWGSTRYIDGAIPTDKEYTGQRHSRDVGLYDYKARWYDPLLGRFLMEDTIIPQQGVMRLDRYSGMMNNPIRLKDPTGNMVACEKDEKCVSIGNSGKDFLNKLEEAGLTEEYEKYQDLKNTPGWWNGNKSDHLTILQYLQLLYSIEHSGSGNDISSEFWKEVTVRDFYAICGDKCNPGSILDILNYISKKLLTIVRDVSPKSMANREKMGELDNLNKTDYVSAFINPKEEWKTGCGNGDMPCTWGNTNLKDCTPESCSWLFVNNPDLDMNAVRERFTYAETQSNSKVPSTKADNFYLMAGTGNKLIIMTENQRKCIYFGNGCP